MRTTIAALILMLYSPSLVWADTLGETSIGGTSTSIENIIIAGRFTPASNGTLDSIYAHIQIGPARTFKCAVFNWDTKDLIDTSTASKGNDSGWIGFDLAFGANIYSDTVYALAAWGDEGGGDAKIFLNFDGGSGAYAVRVYGAWPSSWVLADSTSYLVSIYVTYTPEEEVAAQIIMIQ